jgi:uncharacterized repeat protein (TIGR02543 family)
MKESMNLRVSRLARCVAVALLLVGASARAHDVTVVDGASSNGSWSGDIWTPSAAGSMVAASEIATRLAGGPVTITATGSDKLTVAASFAWSANTLALKAGGDIDIDATLNGSGTAGLALEYGQGAVADDNLATFMANAPVNLASTASFSAKLGSDGAVKSYFIITSLGAPGSTTGTDLQGMAGNLAGNYALGVDINANPTATWNPDGSGGYNGFAPVGTGGTPFTGNFDGLGHVIDGLTIKRNTGFVGLFSNNRGDTIANLGLTDVDIVGRSGLGSLSGNNNRGTIVNAYAQGSVRYSGSVLGVGGLVGGSGAEPTPAPGDSNPKKYRLSRLVKVHAAVEVHGPEVLAIYSQVGGLVGAASFTTITRSYATGNVTARNMVGGLVGFAYRYCDLTTVYATGNVIGHISVGGLVGELGRLTLLDRGYATGNVTGAPHAASENVGGLVGSMYSGGNFDAGSVDNSYATGDVSGGSLVGGLVGLVGGYGGVSTSWSIGHVSGDTWFGGLFGAPPSIGLSAGLLWNVETSGQTQADGFGQPDTGYGATTAEMKSLSTYISAGWNDDVFGVRGISDSGGDVRPWRIYEGLTYPLLRDFLTPLSVADALPDYDGSGTALANIASITAGSVNVPPGADPAHLFYAGPPTATGTPGDTLTLTSTQAGSYTATSNSKVVFGGIYSDQQGYDLTGTVGSRVIATPGSAAGDVWMPNSQSWTDGNLIIDVAGEVRLPSTGTTWTDGKLSIRTPGMVVPGPIVGGAGSVFILYDGTWTQNTAVLPAFGVNDFSLAGSRFLRAAGGAGSVGDPWQLTDIYGLQGMAAFLDKAVVLVNDIDASGTVSWNAGHGFSPLGSSGTPFTGSLDGGNHAVDGLFVVPSFVLQKSYQGLIGYAAGATLTDLSLNSANVRAWSYVGILAGYADAATTVDNVHVSGDVKAPELVGGLVGQSTGSIANSSSSASVDGNDFIGGLVGESIGSVTGSYASGNVTSSAFQSGIGGLIGVNHGGIADSHATGTVYGGENVGGLVGENTGSVIDTYAEGDITNLNDTGGGLIGWTHGNSTVTGSHASGDVTGKGSVGGLIGSNDGGIAQSYATGAATATGEQARAGGLVGSNNGAGIVWSHATGDVSAVAGYPNVSYAGGLVGANSGNVSFSYALGHVVAGTPGGGLITDQAAYAGGLVGDSSGTILQNFVTRSYATGNVVTYGGYTAAGGLIGKLSSGTLSYSYATGDVSGTVYSGSWDLGGLVGAVSNSFIAYNYATGTAATASNDLAGGLVGRLYSGLLVANFWNTDTGVANGVYQDDTGTVDSVAAAGGTLANLKKLATFTPAWLSTRITANGGEGTRWRIYEDQTTPLLRELLSPITVTAYNDAKNVNGVPYSGGNGVAWSDTPDPSLLLGTDPMTLEPLAYGGTSQGATAIGTYSIVPRPYSTQQGYDIIAVAGTLTIGFSAVSGANQPIAVNASPGGTASCTPNPVLYGQNSTCTAAANAGYLFDHWSDDCSGTDATCTLSNVTAARSVLAHFSGAPVETTHAIAINAGAGGAVYCMPNPVSDGGSANCTATANANFAFTGWGGNCSGTDPLCELTNVTAPKSVSASFAATAYSITVNAGTGGTASCTPNPVSPGGNATCTATADSGYTFTGWSGDCSGTTCALNNVTANKSVTASFQADIAITVNASTGGTASCTPNPVSYGGNTTCSATPDAGFHFVNWSGDCSGTTCVLNGVTAAKSVTAVFAVNGTKTYSGASATGSGTINVSFTGGGDGCGFIQSELVGVNVVGDPPPAGADFPHGLFEFITGGCDAGATLSFTITYPSALPPGAQYWKYGPTPDNFTYHWYTIPISLSGGGTIVTFSITDGGLGDADLTANGNVSDPGGPATMVDVPTETPTETPTTTATNTPSQTATTTPTNTPTRTPTGTSTPKVPKITDGAVGGSTTINGVGLGLPGCTPGPIKVFDCGPDRSCNNDDDFELAIVSANVQNGSFSIVLVNPLASGQRIYVTDGCHDPEASLSAVVPVAAAVPLLSFRLIMLLAFALGAIALLRPGRLPGGP